MKKRERVSLINEQDLDSLNHLMKVLGKHIERLEAAYVGQDHIEFNVLKKGVLQIQRKINSLLK